MGERLAELKHVSRDAVVVDEGWRLIQIAPDGSYHLGRYVDVLEDPEQSEIVQFLNSVDPAVVDRLALEDVGFGDKGGTAAIIACLKKLVGS